MDRRLFLSTAGASALAAAAPRAFAQMAGAQGGSDDARLSAAFAAIWA